MAHKTETPVIFGLCVWGHKYMKLHENCMLACPENVTKNFTVWSSIAGVVIWILSTVLFRSAQKGILAPPNWHSWPLPSCLVTATSSLFTLSEDDHLVIRVRKKICHLGHIYYISALTHHLPSSIFISIQKALLRCWKQFCKGCSCSDPAHSCCSASQQ